MDKYVVVKKGYEKNKNEIYRVNNHVDSCEKEKKPLVKVVMGKGYSTVFLDNIFVDYPIREYVKETINDKGQVFCALVMLGIVKSSSCGGNLGDTLYEVDIKTEYALKFAEYIYDTYITAIKEYVNKNTMVL